MQSVRQFALVLTFLSSVPLLAAPPADPRAVDEVLRGERKEARAVWWGFDPADATAALQGAIRSGAARVIVENVGSPWIVTPIQLASNQELVLEKGVVVLARRGEFRGKTDALWTASLCENVTITGHGATLRMWREDYAGGDYAKAEWRHGISLRSCTGVRIAGLTIEDTGGDGIYLGVGKKGVANTDVQIRDVVCQRNHRQGISVISAEKLLIEDCTLRTTGGTAPMAGIDFEPNHPSERLVDCVMRNCVVENNQGDGYLFALHQLRSTSEPVSIRLERCRSQGDRVGFVFHSKSTPDEAVRGRVEAVDCEFAASRGPAVVVSGKPAAACHVRFERCRFVEPAAEEPGQAPIQIVSAPGTTEPMGGIAWVDCTLVDSVDRPPMTYRDLGGGLKLESVTGTLAVERGGQSTTHTLDQALIDRWFPVQAYRSFPPYPLARGELRPLGDAAATRWAAPLRLRERAEYLLWAEKGETVNFTLRLARVGSPPVQPTVVRLRTPAGQETELAEAGEGEHPYRFVAESAGVHTLTCEPGSSTAQIVESDHPVCVVSEGRPMHLVGSAGELYFHVPAGTADFAVRVFGGAPRESVRAALVDPSGRVVEERDNIEGHQFLVARSKSSEGETWTLRIARPSEGVLEDYFVALQGVPPIVATRPGGLLCPRPQP